MCGVVVIVTRWWLGWLLWTVACVMALLGANLSPSWLLGPPTTPYSPHAALVTSPGQPQPAFSTDFLKEQFTEPSAWGSGQERESLGLWLRCTKMGTGARSSLHCGVYITNVPDLPAAQIVALVAVVAATVLTVVSCGAICSTACVRLIKGKSWFTIIGSVQAFAGVLSLAGVAAFPLAWDSQRVQNQCGADAGIYYPSSCTVGWATYITLASSIGLLMCTCLSSFAAKSTSTEDVAEEISKGSNVVCLI
ncbi:LHFPL tetraspan subfamily member 2a protein-like [Homarus americanus]|uniref:LHFPL tetraspan subfamily member 2a protein-like n=1 Tax=Homarus americanus TaxID=6706 RepID=A0A8J5JFA2_HOMAM|nr:LHFPL tetraspan subfamily member 2a protein-like [Homarus americanus]XP_042243524.1 LHFPL tetraspan subfamily member 2a protein-like [Homarus americanus]KAG7157077.1 LHFPL tetraspan subfamily member 2a protein-like [Homarus americanus]